MEKETKAKQIKNNKKVEKTNSGRIDPKNNKVRKLSFIVLLVIIIVLIALIVCLNIFKDKLNFTPTNESYIVTNPDGTSINTSPNIVNDKTYNSLLLSDTKLTYNPDTSENSDGTTTFTTMIKNTSPELSKDQDVNINFLNKEGVVIYTIGAFVASLENGETTSLQATLYGNYLDVYSFEIVPLQQVSE